METLKIKSKIKTGISGLDDLFYGGLRLPDRSGKKGICIAIYGNRGISKQDIAMQIMYGTTQNENHSTCRYYDINRKAGEMKRRYYGLHIGRLIQQIRRPKQREIVRCDLCDYFELKKILTAETCIGKKEVACYHLSNGGGKWNNNLIVKCNREKKIEVEAHCDLCKMIRHEIINYNDRTHALHWTISSNSDESNKFSDEKDDYIGIFNNVFDNDDYDDKTPIQRYTSIYQKIKELPETNDLDSIVIGGFTAIGDELYKLQYNTLIDELRKKAKVSILVFDERGKDLHLNADILIEMRVREDEHTHYIHHELRVAKSDLQRHVYGWHHYKKLRDLSIEVYPNVHALMSHRFSSTYALARLERDSLKHHQTLLQKFQDSVESYDPKASCKQNNVTLIKKLSSLKHSTPETQSKSHLDISFSDKLNINELCEQARNETILLMLFGKDEIAISSKVRETIGVHAIKTEPNTTSAHDKNKSISPMERIHCCSVRPSDILPEEILGVIKQYVNHWWNNTTKESTLHIYIDDLAQFWLYPLLYREQNFLPALFSICNEVRYERDFRQKFIEHQIVLHLICSEENHPQCSLIKQLEKWNKDY